MKQCYRTALSMLHTVKLELRVITWSSEVKPSLRMILSLSWREENSWHSILNEGRQSSLSHNKVPVSHAAEPRQTSQGDDKTAQVKWVRENQAYLTNNMLTSLKDWALASLFLSSLAFLQVRRKNTWLYNPNTPLHSWHGLFQKALAVTSFPTG